MGDVASSGLRVAVSIAVELCRDASDHHYRGFSGNYDRCGYQQR